MQSYLNTPGYKLMSKQFQGNSLTDIVPKCDNTTFGCCESCDNLPKLTVQGVNCQPKIFEKVVVIGINMF